MNSSDRTTMHEAVAAGDLRILVMSLFHLTGDRRWLEAPYRPARDVRLIADPTAGYAPDVQAEIRATVIDMLEREVRPVIDDPGNELLGELMSVCLGEQVPSEYVAMMRDDMGFTSSDPMWSDAARDRAGAPDVVIVGAGFSGMGLAVQLDRLGIKYTVIEKNPDVGGTWFENRYPGCGVDTPNHFYSFSAFPNYGWSRYFSGQPELQAYAERYADTFTLRPNIRFNTRVTGAIWDDDSQRWDITVRTPIGDDVVSAAVFVSAIGHFNEPVTPVIAGLDEFSGPMFHTARWPTDLDIADKHVAVIGTGASAMQIVPTIVDAAASVTVYQRSPQWVRELPEYNDEVRPGTPWLLENVAYYALWNRFTLFWRYGDGLLRFLAKDPDWPHPGRSLNRVNDRHRQEITDYIERELAGRPDLIEKCVPTYPPYGKRILLDKGWFKAIRRPTVELVTEPIERVESGGVVTADGTQRNADVVVLSTGFSVTDLSARLGIVGRHGRTLADDWANDNPHAYLGITVPGFPNFFCMFGPNTNMGHGGSGIFLGECQARYIGGCVVAMAEKSIASLDCLPASRDEFIARVDALHENLVWTHPGMSTYYRNRSGRVVSPMPFRLVDYWGMTRQPDLDDFIATQRGPNCAT